METHKQITQHRRRRFSRWRLNKGTLPIASAPPRPGRMRERGRFHFIPRPLRTSCRTDCDAGLSP